MVPIIPTAITAIIVSIKEKLIDWKTGISISIFGVIGAVIGAKISINMNVKLLKKCFGIFLLLISAYEIYSFIKQYIINKKTDNKITSKNKIKEE